MVRARTAAAAVLTVALAAAVAAQVAKPKVYKPSGTPRKSSPAAKSKSSQNKTASQGRSSAQNKNSRRRTMARTRPKSKKAQPKQAPRPRGQMRPTPERYKEIEEALAARGYLNEEPTGQWGPSSIEALRAFQADHQLPPTGKLDALSLIQLGLGPKQ